MFVFNVVKQLPGSTRFFFSCSCPSTSLGHLLMFEALKADGHYLAAQNAFGKPRDFLGPGPWVTSTTDVKTQKNVGKIRVFPMVPSQRLLWHTGLGTRPFHLAKWGGFPMIFLAEFFSPLWESFVESNLRRMCLIFFFPNGFVMMWFSALR